MRFQGRRGRARLLPSRPDKPSARLSRSFALPSRHSFRRSKCRHGQAVAGALDRRLVPRAVAGGGRHPGRRLRRDHFLQWLLHRQGQLIWAWSASDAAPPAREAGSREGRGSRAPPRQFVQRNGRLVAASVGGEQHSTLVQVWNASCAVPLARRGTSTLVERGVWQVLSFAACATRIPYLYKCGMLVRHGGPPQDATPVSETDHAQLIFEDATPAPEYERIVGDSTK